MRNASHYGINISATAVFACKEMLLALKAWSVGKVVSQSHKNSQLHRIVIAIEQTSDAYLASLLMRMADVIGLAKVGRFGLHLCHFDALPLANSTLIAEAVADASSVGNTASNILMQFY